MRFVFWVSSPLRRLVEALTTGRPSFQLREQARPPCPVPPRAGPKPPPPTPRLDIEVVETKDEVVVRLRGEAGVPEALVLEASVMRLAAKRPACVTFDLSELTGISALAMGVLTTYRRAAIRAGARVCLAPSLAPAVREALTRAEVLSLFESGGRATGHFPNVYEVQRKHGIAWDELVALEPEMQTLLCRARMAGCACRTRHDVERAFAPVRNDLAGLVGLTGKHCRHLVLGSIGAYEVAYWKLYDAVAALLPCRDAPRKDAELVAAGRPLPAGGGSVR